MNMAEKLVSMAVRRPRMWVLTGAGISTESGIPDFRSPGSGLWETVDPMEVFSVDGLARNPKRFYDIGYGMFDGILKAPSNRAHQALGKLQQWGLIGPVVTQNIDNLHQKGGAFWVYEVHGHVRSATCMGCGGTKAPMREVLDQAAAGAMPRCHRCQSLMKPDVILFGDAMPADYMNVVMLMNTYRHHSLSMLVVGSSLVVAPINSLPADFDEIAIINNDKTMLDYKADLLWNEQAGDALTAVEDYIYQQTGSHNPERLPYGFLPGAIIGNTLDKCLGVDGKPKDLPSEQAANTYAEAILWQETMENYLAHRSTKGIAGLVAHTWLDLLQPVTEAYKSDKVNRSRAPQLVQNALIGLANDHLAVLEAYLQSSQNTEECLNHQTKELLLGTAMGTLGWYEWLSREWGVSCEGTKALLHRPVERGYATKEEVVKLTDEY